MIKKILILNPSYKRSRLARLTKPKKRRSKMAKRRKSYRSHRKQIVIIKARRRRARRNPTFGRHRVSMKWTVRGWKSKSRKLGRRRPVRINPFHGSNRVIDKKLLIQGLTVAAGLYAGVHVQKWLNRQSFVSANTIKYTGIVNIALGTLMALKARKDVIKSAGVGVVASGIWDLISKNLTGVGLTPLVGLDVSGEDELLGYGEQNIDGLDVSGNDEVVDGIDEVVDGVEVIDGEDDAFSGEW